MKIVLVRHGESQTNARQIQHGSVPDHLVELTDLGRSQAREAGGLLGADFLRSALLYRSPYVRARQTFEWLLTGAEVPPHELRYYEDPRLREVDHGYEDIEAQQKMRETHGWFYYRFKGGESPADCYDRVSGFVESLMRQVTRKRVQNVLIVTHGLTIRCFVMRFFHMSVERFDMLANPKNCDLVEIATPVDALDGAQFKSGRWCVRGLRDRYEQPPARVERLYHEPAEVQSAPTPRESDALGSQLIGFGGIGPDFAPEAD